MGNTDRHIPLCSMRRCNWQRSSSELPQLRQRSAQKEAGGGSQAVGRKGMQNLAIAAQHATDRVGPPADPHPHQRPLDIARANPVLLHQTQHQLEIPGDSGTTCPFIGVRSTSSTCHACHLHCGNNRNSMRSSFSSTVNKDGKNRVLRNGIAARANR